MTSNPVYTDDNISENDEETPILPDSELSGSHYEQRITW